MQEKVEKATRRRAEVVAELEKVISGSHQKLEARREELSESLFSSPSEEFLLRATLASDEELAHIADAGIRARSEGLTKAALHAAIERDKGEILSRIFEARPDLESSYRELQLIPQPEVPARQADPSRIRQLVPEPSSERLRPRPRVQAF